MSGQEALNVFCDISMSLSEFSSGAQNEVVNCVAILPIWLESILESNFVKRSAYRSDASADDSGTAPSTSVRESSNGGS